MARQDPGHATGENGSCAGFELRSRLDFGVENFLRIQCQHNCAKR